MANYQKLLKSQITNYYNFKQIVSLVYFYLKGVIFEILCIPKNVEDTRSILHHNDTNKKNQKTILVNLQIAPRTTGKICGGISCLSRSFERILRSRETNSCTVNCHQSIGKIPLRDVNTTRNIQLRKVAWKNKIQATPEIKNIHLKEFTVHRVKC